MLRRLRRRCHNLYPTQPTLQVALGMPDTDVVIVGGRSPRHVRGTATTYQLPPNKYTIRVTKAGYNLEERRVFELKKGVVLKLPQIDLTAVKLAAPVPAPPPWPFRRHWRLKAERPPLTFQLTGSRPDH